MTLPTGVKVTVLKQQGRFSRIRIAQGTDEARGEFFFLVSVQAGATDLYLPLSIASGKKPAGIVYEIEGTGDAALERAEISVQGKNVTQLLVGTITYATIPAGSSGIFRIVVHMRGEIGKEYRVILRRIHYKSDPTVVRYQKLEEPVVGKLVKFK